ncbi:hypothetical protein Tco_0289071 [Tanacetum coccineum]
MVQLHVCTCNGDSSYKDHAQLLKLIQFVMGLDDVYGPIRSTILTTDPLPTVKEAFSLFSREESHRLSHSGGSGVKGNNIAFVARPLGDIRGSSSFVPRCFELVGYPPNFKKKDVTSKNVTFNVPVSRNDTDTRSSTPHTLTSD